MPDNKHTRPPCPKCGSAILVRRHGWLTRKATGERVQMWGCLRCRRWFNDPDKYVGRKGALPNLEKRDQALRLRRAGLTFAEIGKRLGVHATYAYRLANFTFVTRGGIPVGRKIVLHI